ncbi:MAG: hypothetical protein A3E01_18805 [Gammaproteobacteria bacterium RIFCSPHIGHO2_12_FULL_63_22]|nr:MAG: hypothetical protein A3E01_18805 [Gammaproteobacteria bacterium RIFCSPHIGHO2_12_FULL_63_22]
MTFDEFINVITQPYVDALDQEKAMAFIQSADSKTLLAALGTNGVMPTFKTAIQKALEGKVPQENIDAALARITEAASKPKGP